MTLFKQIAFESEDVYKNLQQLSVTTMQGDFINELEEVI